MLVDKKIAKGFICCVGVESRYEKLLPNTKAFQHIYFTTLIPWKLCLNYIYVVFIIFNTIFGLANGQA